MKKYASMILALVLVCSLLTGCFPLDRLLSCNHEWAPATCEVPQTCKRCQETVGVATGHDLSAATCTEAPACVRCKKVVGEALGHDFMEADCQSAKQCKVCGYSEGDPLSHHYVSEVIQQPSCDANGILAHTCDKCGMGYNEQLPATIYSAVEISEMYQVSVGEVLTYDVNGYELALGTCVVYSEDGKLITNYHVIEDAVAAVVKIDGRSYEVQYVLAYDKDIDLAVLKIDATGLTPATFCDQYHATGNSVFAIGSSKGMEYTLSQGIITHAERELDGVVYVQHDAAISGGNSGGPLVNVYGEVIGINTMTIIDSQNLNFAIQISELDNLVYGEKLTMEQFYDKECNLYVTLKNYIIQNGTYKVSSYGSSNYYIINMGTYYSSDSKFTRYAYYYVDDGSITFDLAVDDGDYYIYITIDQNIDGVYDWDYFDDYDYEMSGTIYGATFDENTLLGYSSNNITNSTVRDSVRELASTMMDLLLLFVNTDLSDLGITAADLGFLNY